MFYNCVQKSEFFPDGEYNQYPPAYALYFEPRIYALEHDNYSFELHVNNYSIDVYVFEIVYDDNGISVGDSTLVRYDSSPFAVVPEPYLAEVFLCHYGTKYIEEKTQKVLTTV